jgi:hypothetical protein
MNIEQVKSELRQEVRALQLERKLSGYALHCCLEDIPEDEMREMLIHRVIRMTDPALAVVSERTGYSFKDATQDMLWVLAEECHRIVERIEDGDVKNLAQAVETNNALTSGPAN